MRLAFASRSATRHGDTHTMAKRMLIDAAHAEETRVVVLDGNRLEESDFELANKALLKGTYTSPRLREWNRRSRPPLSNMAGGATGFWPSTKFIPTITRYRFRQAEAPRTAGLRRGGCERRRRQRRVRSRQRNRRRQARRRPRAGERRGGRRRGGLRRNRQRRGRGRGHHPAPQVAGRVTVFRRSSSGGKFSSSR